MQRSKTYRAAADTFDRDELHSPYAAIKIAKTKETDLNAHDIDQAAKIIAGTARSMGITVVDA